MALLEGIVHRAAMAYDPQEKVMTPQDFYRSHSPMSDPCAYTHLYDASRYNKCVKGVVCW